ncbi:MAG TPA: NUDIX hydrolase [Pirellulaceae bacterium]|nr:NUDIX hydrolase [Pirellulaceae bacterium]
MSKDYPKPSVSVDLVIVRPVADGSEALLIRRGHDPFEGCWALPGGFMDIDETLEAAACRELLEETSVRVSPDQLVQVGAFSRIDRDPRGRVISVAFLAQVPSETVARAGDDARETAWHHLNRLPPLAFDHAEIVAAAWAVISQPSV